MEQTPPILIPMETECVTDRFQSTLSVLQDRMHSQLDPSAGDTDTDGDGKPDTSLPSTSVPPLEEDMDDDGDGVEDVNETGTWTYNVDQPILEQTRSTQIPTMTEPVMDQ